MSDAPKRTIVTGPDGIDRVLVEGDDPAVVDEIAAQRAVPGAPEDESAAADLGSLTKRELLDHARSRGLDLADVNSKSTKPEIVAAIRAAES